MKKEGNSRVWEPPRMVRVRNDTKDFFTSEAFEYFKEKYPSLSGDEVQGVLDKLQELVTNATSFQFFRASVDNMFRDAVSRQNQQPLPQVYPLSSIPPSLGSRVRKAAVERLIRFRRRG